MSKLFNDTSRFWVVFDTCTVPEYYLDVHKLLALPTGATLRYNYREKYLSESAVTASLSPATAPQLALLVYGQRKGFTKGEGTPKTGSIFPEMLWIPTRIVQMLCIPSRDGESFNYDFKVLRYPCIDREALMRILDPLIQHKEIPFNKWVTLSSELIALENLQQGDDRRNWGSIVSEFHRPEFQFSSDVFWRIIGPTNTKTNKVVVPRYEQILDANAPRLVRAVYDIEEGQNHGFEIVSSSPPRSLGKPLTQYSVNCSSTNQGNVEIVGSGVISLRQEAADNVQFIGKIAEEIADHGSTLFFETQPKPEHWPGGPEMELLFAVVKNKAKMIIGVVLAVLAILIGAYGAEELKSSLVRGLACLAVGTAIAIISGLLLFKKLSFKT